MLPTRRIRLGEISRFGLIDTQVSNLQPPSARTSDLKKINLILIMLTIIFIPSRGGVEYFMKCFTLREYSMKCFTSGVEYFIP